MWQKRPFMTNRKDKKDTAKEDWKKLITQVWRKIKEYWTKKDQGLLIINR